jgi:hypothetical protein
VGDVVFLRRHVRGRQVVDAIHNLSEFVGAAAIGVSSGHLGFELEKIG